MNTTITKDGIKQCPVVEQIICSYASVEKGAGSLSVLTDVITKEITFKVIGNTGEEIVEDLDKAIDLYNLMQL